MTHKYFPTLLDVFVLGGLGIIALSCVKNAKDMDCWLCGHRNVVTDGVVDCRRCGIENVVVNNQLRGGFPSITIPTGS